MRTALLVSTLAALSLATFARAQDTFQELMIDPLGEAPAELRAYIIYQVRNHHRVESWQVTLDAETGKVVDSFSRMMNAQSARRPPGDAH